MSARAQGKREALRASLWVWPTMAAAGSFALTLVLVGIRPEPGTPWASAVWPGGKDAASTTLQVVARAVMTATTSTFSLTVVALQLAAQQFSPRLLRAFARDTRTQVVLAVMVSTFVVARTGLRGTGSEEPLPVLVPATALLMGLASAVALMMFLGHIVRSLRVDSMMVAVHEEAVATVSRAWPDHGDRAEDPAAHPPGPGCGILLPSSRSGFVKVVRPEVLAGTAAEHGVFVLLGVRPGDHVTAGSPLGGVWTDDGAPAAEPEVLEQTMTEAVEMGFERTLEQDAALGQPQLTDIAVTAVSPGVDDPITAAHAVGHCSDLVARLQSKHPGPQQHVDSGGVPRVVTADPDHPYDLDLVCGPVRRYGAGEPLVLSALLRLLRACACAARDDRQRAGIARQDRLVMEATDSGLIDSDAEEGRDLARQVEVAVAGQFDDAFRNRAGETRSV